MSKIQPGRVNMNTYHNVPSADSADNTTMSDVIGNKTDTGAGDSIYSQTDKIDSASVDGLAGTNNSLAYKVHEIEKHFHNNEHWLGKLGVQTATAWAENSLAPFRAISGANTYGADANDEAQVLGTDDTPITVSYVKYDLHKILFTALSTDTPWKIRLVWGTTTIAQAIADGNTSEMVAQNNPAGSKAGGSPVPVMMPRLNCGTDKLWIQAWNNTDDATADFLIGLHEYAG